MPSVVRRLILRFISDKGHIKRAVSLCNYFFITRRASFKRKKSNSIARDRDSVRLWNYARQFADLSRRLINYYNETHGTEGHFIIRTRYATSQSLAWLYALAWFNFCENIARIIEVLHRYRRQTRRLQFPHSRFSSFTMRDKVVATVLKTNRQSIVSFDVRKKWFRRL